MARLMIGAILGVLGLLDGQALSDPGTTAEAVREGLLVLELGESPARITAWERIDVRIRLRNKSALNLSVPKNWPYPLAAEIVTVNGGATFVWRRPTSSSAAGTTPLAPGADTGWLHTSLWFASEPLEGLPGENPYLPAGKYKWRLVLSGDLPLRSEWTRIEVVQPTLSKAAAAAAKRRPEGRLILVVTGRPCPKPDGSVEHPYGHLREALASAKAGDVVFCEPGWHTTNACTVPDEVWLLGSGAGETVVTVVSARNAPNRSRVKVEGRARLEGLTLRANPGRGALIDCVGPESRPTLYQCALLPADNDFSAVTARKRAAPLLRNCIIVSPVGDYGVFARNDARPTIEYCTIISRGFGVGMMDQSVATIRRSIIAGRCPAVISDDGEFALSDSVIFCPVPGGTHFTHAVMRSRQAADATDGPSYVPLEGVMRRKDILNVDPQFVLKGKLPEFFSLRPGSVAGACGAFAGKGGDWLAGSGRLPAWALPDLKNWGLTAWPEVKLKGAGELNLEPAETPAETTYVLSGDELTDIRKRVVELLVDDRPAAPNVEVRYSTGISHFDSWVPMPAQPRKAPPDRSHYRWEFVAGRVVRVEYVKAGKAHLEHALRYDDRGAPVLCVNHKGAGIGDLILADYDSRGLLCRTVYLSKALAPVRVDVYENEEGYASTTHWSFTPRGKFISRTRYAGGDLLYVGPPDNVEKRVNSGTRLWWIRSLERYGLASVYPIPAPGPRGGGRGKYDPAAVRLEIVGVAVTSAGVGKQVRGSFAVRNSGPAFEIPADVVDPGYGVLILDLDGKVLFRKFGATGGPFPVGRRVTVGFDTSSNHLGETSGPPFVVPGPGTYVLQVAFYRDPERKTTICEKSAPFTVK